MELNNANGSKNKFNWQAITAAELETVLTGDALDVYNDSDYRIWTREDEDGTTLYAITDDNQIVGEDNRTANSVAEFFTALAEEIAEEE